MAMAFNRRSVLIAKNDGEEAVLKSIPENTRDVGMSGLFLEPHMRGYSGTERKGKRFEI